MKYCIVLGTRPEIIKQSSIIRFLNKEKKDFFIIHSNQHYSENLDKVFFNELELTEPKYNLNIGSASHGKQTGKMLEMIEEVLIKETPDIVLVQGDTNTVLAGALAASKLKIKVGHIEAGLRSYDRTMPEEINRIVTDHISDYLFAPTEKSKNILLSEGINEKKVIVTGNTIVDAVLQNIKIAEKNSTLFKKFDLREKSYLLLTAHRAENTDSKAKLNGILQGASKLSENIKMPTIYPIHPRTKKMIEQHKIIIPKNIILIDPIGFLDFLFLQKHAKLILTDSGGKQEESCILQVPCVTLRENTERPETIEAGGNVLAGTNPEIIQKCAMQILTQKNDWINPFGKGDTGEIIINSII
jgi:UDP-N-acetylglucosamine 2-epimerase (non-hydrolysing)